MKDSDKQIIKLYQSGNYTQTELAKMFNTSPASVSRIVNKPEFKKCKENRKNPKEEQNKQIIKLHETGNYTMQELAKMFDTSQSSVSRIIHKPDPKKSKKCSKTYSRDIQIIKLYETGNYSQKELAKMFGLSQSNMSCITNKSEFKKSKVHRRDKQIIELYETGDYTQTALAKMFGMTRANMSLIINKIKKEGLK